MKEVAAESVANPPADSQKSVELAIASAVILGSLIAWLQTSVEIQMHRKDGKLDFSFKLKKDKTEGKTLAAVATTRTPAPCDVVLPHGALTHARLSHG